MIAIAQKIIEQKQGPFDPSRFVDRYEEALKAMIEDKTKGRKPAKISAPEDTNVVDLMAALRASLEAKGSSAKAPGAKASDAPSESAAKSSAAKPRRRKAS